MYRGSRKHILDWVEQPEFLPQLLELVKPVKAKITSNSSWAPMGYRYPDEARLGKWGPVHFGLPEAWKELNQWWLAEPHGANTPNWDLAVVAEIEGIDGLLLLEAKGHVSELSTSGKRNPQNTKGSRANHDSIGKAIQIARHGLAKIEPSIDISRDSHYQLSNRLAFTWKLATLGIPVVLIYLGFLGDDGIADVGPPFENIEKWVSTFTTHFNSVKALGLMDQRNEIGRTPFWVLARARQVIEVSPHA